MKVIDLLNKKANGEELPSEINCYNQTFYLSDGIYIAENQAEKYFEDYFDFSSLDYEVEIIEDTPKEDKKIEKLDLEELNDLLRADLSYDNLFHKTHKMLVKTKSKINEIIDKINGDSNERNK